MRKSILSLAILSAFSLPSFASASEEVVETTTKEPESAWSLSSNVGVVSDYYARGISQSWHKPAVQGGLDITHSNGFYAGAWGSSITPNTFPDATVELDAYAGYNGSIAAVEGLGYTVGAIGYFYPGGSWKKYRASNSVHADDKLTPNGGSWNTYEANFGLSYKWLSAKASVTLSDWYGADKKTGWDGSTKGTTYLELNAAYPLPWEGLTLVAHVGHLNVAGKLDLSYADGNGNLPSTSISNATSPDYTDWKVGLSKAFKVANSDGWNAGAYWVESSNSDYWGSKGYGGTSFNGAGTSTKAQSKNLNEGRLILSIGRSF